MTAGTGEHLDCSVCGRGEDKAQQFDEHHLIPQRLQGPNTPDNLVTVCKRCHKSLERIYNQDFWKNVGLLSDQTPRDIEATQITPRLFSEFRGGRVSVYCGCGATIISNIATTKPPESFNMPRYRSCCDVGHLDQYEIDYTPLTYICFRNAGPDLHYNTLEIEEQSEIPKGHGYGAHPNELENQYLNLPIAFTAAWSRHLEKHDQDLDTTNFIEFINSASQEWGWSVEYSIPEEDTSIDISTAFWEAATRWIYERDQRIEEDVDK